MPLSLDALLNLWLQRERDAGPTKNRDRETLEFFEGRVAVPLPEIDANERSAVANLMAQGITAQAQRIGSTTPNVTFTPDSASKAASQRARAKRKALVGMWDENRLHLQRRQRARWLIAYATSPVLIRPAFRDGAWSVKWEMRSALSAYPAPTPQHLDMEPRDVIFASTQNSAKLGQQYPDKAGELRLAASGRGPTTIDASPTLLQYCGPDEYITAAVFNVDPHSMPFGLTATGNKAIVELERYENRVGRCCSIIPNAISLESPLGRYEGMKGLYQMQAKLMALEYRYVANSVDPPIWFVEADTGGQIIEPADGPAGVVGHVRNGQLVALNPPAGVGTNNMIDRLERAQRLEGGVSPDLGGESGTGIRTGARGQDILAAVMDFPIQEAQELLAESQFLEDNLAIETALAYFPDLKRMWGGFEFTPSATFTKGDWHSVDYSIAGADANGLVIRLGQLQGTGLISRHTARAKIPDIADAEFEDDMVTAEQINDGILAEFMQPSQPGVPGGLDLPAKARVMQLVRDDKKDLADAILLVQQEAQQRQAPAAEPVAPGAPEAQPGIGGAASQAGTVGPSPDLAGLSSLLGSLRTPQAFATPQERVAEAQATVG